MNFLEVVGKIIDSWVYDYLVVFILAGLYSTVMNVCDCIHCFRMRWDTRLTAHPDTTGEVKQE
jgi:hypothetical protein